jgi:hypothetical protein
VADNVRVEERVVKLELALPGKKLRVSGQGERIRNSRPLDCEMIAPGC